MLSNVSTNQTVADIINDDPALLEELRRASTKQEFISKLVAAAQAKGVVVDEVKLSQEFDLAHNRLVEQGELSDEQLEEVSGGIAFGPIAVFLAKAAVVAVFATASAVAANEINKARK